MFESDRRCVKGGLEGTAGLRCRISGGGGWLGGGMQPPYGPLGLVGVVVVRLGEEGGEGGGGRWRDGRERL